VNWCPKVECVTNILPSIEGTKKEATHKDNTHEEAIQKEAIEKDHTKTSGLDRVEVTQSEVGKIKPN